MTDTSCSAERPPNSNPTRSLSAMSWSPESACWERLRRKGRDWSTGVDARVGAEQKGRACAGVRRDPRRDAAPRGPGKRSIDRWTAINGVDPLAGLRYTYVGTKGDK
jgi:hypothetical protein